MSLPLLPTTLIGSMPKPGWLTSEWFSITEKWRLSGKELAEGFDDATRLALADQERAGIDIVCDGEQRRPTHFSYFLAQLNNVDFVNLGARRRRGGKTLTQVPRITGPISLRMHHTLNDFHALRKLTQRPIKMTLPGPCTLVDGVADHYYSDERTLAFAFADALNQEIRALAETGCDMVQIDEPSITRLPQQVHTWGVQAMDRAFEGVTAKTCVHVCYGYRSRQSGGKEWKHVVLYPSAIRSGQGFFCGDAAGGITQRAVGAATAQLVNIEGLDRRRKIQTRCVELWFRRRRQRHALAFGKTHDGCRHHGQPRAV